MKIIQSNNICDYCTLGNPSSLCVDCATHHFHHFIGKTLKQESLKPHDTNSFYGINDKAFSKNKFQKHLKRARQRSNERRKKSVLDS